MSSVDICEQYLAGKSCSREYERQLRLLARRIGKIDAKSINSHLRERLASVSATTARNERRQAMTLWRWAYEERLVGDPPRGVMRIRDVSRPVRAWTLADCQRLVNGASAFFGKKLRNGADIGVFLQTWVVLGYETGARYGDLFGLRAGDLHDRAISWTSSKSGVACTRALSPHAVALCKKMLESSPDGTILGWVGSRRYTFRLLRRLLDACVDEGSGKWLRRSSATHVEQAFPGKAQWFLGHKSPGMAARHYLDQSQLAGMGVAPPPLRVTHPPLAQPAVAATTSAAPVVLLPDPGSRAALARQST